MLQDGDGAIPDGMSGECSNSLPPPSSRGRLTETLLDDSLQAHRAGRPDSRLCCTQADEQEHGELAALL